MKKAYSAYARYVQSSRKKISLEEAEKELHEWYKEVCGYTLREIKAARDAIKGKEQYVLIYFFNWSTQCYSRVTDSKIKGFRSQQHGIYYI